MNTRIPSGVAAALIALWLAGPRCHGQNASPAGDAARQLNEAFVEVAEKVSPAVVVINVVQRVSVEPEENNPNDSFPPGFWREFHKQFQRPERSYEEGSGIIFRPNGYILTNRHVVEGAERIDVRLKDGRVFKAAVRGVDPQSDVAVLKIEAEGLPVARLADSDRTRVGEFAIAVGAPFSLDYSVTFGHVSAKGRSGVIEGTEGQAMDQDFIQTDAQINPGNSGGPLVNLEGEVIGMNTLIRGLHTGIGFAIPSNLVKEVAEHLIESGKFKRAWLGVGILALRDQPDLRQLIKGTGDGVVVTAILPEGPAAKSDLKPSDIITAVDGSKVATPQELRAAVRGKAVGQPLTLDVFRKDKTVHVKVIPAEWVQPVAAVAKASKPGMQKVEPTGLGLTVQELTRDLAKRFGLDPSQTDGVLIAAVAKDSPAALKQLKPGDIITSVNQQPVSSKKQFDAALKKADPKQGVLINLVSDKTARFEIIKPLEP
ncbi:MAG TPA: trypsin-like peptidase domain-containing protein [Verrucomicrobiae bacterium]